MFFIRFLFALNLSFSFVPSLSAGKDSPLSLLEFFRDLDESEKTSTINNTFPPTDNSQSETQSFYSPQWLSSQEMPTQLTQISQPTRASFVHDFSNNGEMEILEYASAPDAFGGRFVDIDVTPSKSRTPASYTSPYHAHVVYSETQDTEYSSYSSPELPTFFHSPFSPSPTPLAREDSPVSLPTTVLDGPEFDGDEGSQSPEIVRSSRTPEEDLLTPPPTPCLPAKKSYTPILTPCSPTPTYSDSPTPYTPTQVLRTSQYRTIEDSGTVKKRKNIEIDDKENANPNSLIRTSQTMKKPGRKLSQEASIRIQAVEERMHAFDHATIKVSAGPSQFRVPARGTQGQPHKPREAKPIKLRDPKLGLNVRNDPDEII